MTPRQAIQLTLKEMRAWPDKNKTHPWVKKVMRRFEATLKEAKAKGYSPEFERFIKAYPCKSGGKMKPYDSWLKEVVERDIDPEVVISAIPHYIKECKQTETSFAHPTTWLNQWRWESYEGETADVKRQRMCQFCQCKPAVHLITCKQYAELYGYDVSVSCRVCDDCRKYEGGRIDGTRKMKVR